VGVDRELILKTATRLFQEKGFSRVTTDEIAAGSGITKRTLYKYIGSKEALLLAIHEKFLERVLAAADPQGRPDEQIVDLLRNYIRTVVANPDEIRVFFEERKHLSPASLARVVELRDRYEQVFRDTLARGISDGTFRGCDLSLVTEGVLGAVADMYEWYRPGGRLDADQITDVFAALFLGGLRKAATELSRQRSREPVRGREEATAETASGNDDAGVDRDWSESPVLVRILDAASDIMYDQGYDNMSTRGLAEAAGLTRSALYYYIPSKEEVLFQVNRRLARFGLGNVRQIIAETADPVEALRAIVVAHCETVARNMGALRALSYEMRFLDPPHHAEILALRRDYAKTFSGAVRAAVGGKAANARGTDVLAIAIMGMLNFMHHWYIEGARLSATKIGETFFDLIWNGLLAAPAKRKR
jgi:AcrR family transcriptional regulator